MSRRAASTDRVVTLRVAAFASVGAAVVHFAVVPSHWGEWVPAGQFFVAVACFQLVWAHLAVSRPSRPVLACGVLANAGLALLWVMAVTIGPPVGPHAGEPETVRAAGLCVLLLQLYVVMGAAWVWRRGRNGAVVPAYAHAVVLLVFGGVVAAASAVGMISGLRHDHGSAVTADSDHHEHTPAPAAPRVAVPIAPSAPAPPAPAPPPADAHVDHHH